MCHILVNGEIRSNLRYSEIHSRASDINLDITESEVFDSWPGWVHSYCKSKKGKNNNCRSLSSKIGGSYPTR